MGVEDVLSTGVVGRRRHGEVVHLQHLRNLVAPDRMLDPDAPAANPHDQVAASVDRAPPDACRVEMRSTSLLASSHAARHTV